MDSWKIRNGTLEFYEDDHVYLYEGIQLPSVTQIVGRRFNKDYANVPREVLNKAGERGTKVHEDIEKYCKTGHGIDTPELRNFKFLQKQYGFEVLDNELPIVIFEDDYPVACGRLDMTIEMNGHVGIGDIKTNSALNKEKIAYQLNLYRLGLMQSYGVEAEFLRVIHLRNDVRKFVELPVQEELTIEWLKEDLQNE